MTDAATPPPGGGEEPAGTAETAAEAVEAEPATDEGRRPGGLSTAGAPTPEEALAADLEDEEGPEAALALLAHERDEYLDQLRRARADYENLNKRKTRELMEALDRGASSVVSQLLGVLDHFAFAIDAAKASEDDRLAKGVEMVHNELLGVLKQAGLEELPGVGQPFDPAVHEALMQVDAADELGEEVDEPVVADVLRTGYGFKGRVLRPASVKVAR